MKRIAGSFVLVVLCTFVFFNTAFSQEADKMLKLRLAQGFEEGNEWEHAAALYEELYTSEPANYIFLNGLRRCYGQLKEYDKAISIIRTWFIKHPRDINLMTSLGGLYYTSGNESAADSVWQTVLSIDPRNIQSYSLVANEMMQHRLYEQCIRTYLSGRTMVKNEVLFADEVGTLYVALQQYTSATQEYLHLLRKNPEQISFVQSRLSAMIFKPEALRAASEITQTEITNAPNNIALRRLYVWLLMEERHYDSALEQYRTIDHLSNANGRELFNFAQQLNQEHASEAAVKAFKEIIDHYEQTDLLAPARFGYARALEELSGQTDILPSTLQPSMRDALQLYESIAGSRDHPDLAAQALFRIGVIKFEILFDLDGALLAFNKIKELPLTATIMYDAALKCGDVLIARNDLAGARKEFERTAKLSLSIFQDQALFKLAELNYFEAQFDTALFMLNRFTLNLNTDLTNDALQLQYFIQENKSSSPSALTEFAKADLQMRQRKFSEALHRFQDIIKQDSTALLVDDALMKIGELHLKLKQPNEAIAVFRSIADSIQLSILKDRALFRIAEISESTLRNTSLAIEAYQLVLERFPNSLYAEQARKRIRSLRGDGA